MLNVILDPTLEPGSGKDEKMPGRVYIPGTCSEWVWRDAIARPRVSMKRHIFSTPPPVGEPAMFMWNRPKMQKKSCGTGVRFQNRRNVCVEPGFGAMTSQKSDLDPEMGTFHSHTPNPLGGSERY